MSASSFDPHAAVSSLLGRLDADVSRSAGLTISGTDPVIATPFRVGAAAAVAIAANAAAAADLWCLRGGTPQTIAVDIRAAAASLLSFMLLQLPNTALPREAPATVALYEARGGEWVHLHGGFPHLHDGTLHLLGCADDATDIAHAVGTWEAQALEDVLAERGLCGARLRTSDEWQQHPQGRALAKTPLVEVLRIGDAPPEPLPGPPAGASSRPLTGVRVLDLTRVLAGPTCARTLAEHGAEVLHVRSPHRPFIEPFVIDTNPGKRSCHLDLTQDDDVETLRELARGADVFSQGYRADALARRGFGPEALAHLRPGIIAVSINCYGHTGPWAARPGWEQLAQTVTGVAHEHGGGQSPPSIIPAAVTDYTTGHLAALGVLTALRRRVVEGGSWHVRVSLARTAMWLQSLPRVAADTPPSGLDPAALQPWFITMDTAWGPLARLGPIARMSATAPRWDLPPVPLGTHPPAWT